MCQLVSIWLLKPDFKERALYLQVSFSVQSEYGDLYKISLAYDGDTVKELRIKYFDTIPPCTSICVLKTGFLFAASEFGNHALYQFLVSLSPLSLRSSSGRYAVGDPALGYLAQRQAPCLVQTNDYIPAGDQSLYATMFLPCHC